MPHTRSIERDFPIEVLSRLAELESWRKEVNRPTYYVHKWWARRLGSVFRAILLGSLLDEPVDVWQHFYCSHNFEDQIILDPFMGGGTTVGEAIKLGCRVVAADINPVAWYLVRSSLQRVEPSLLKQAYRRIEQKVASRIHYYYQSTWQGQPAQLLYAFWVKVIPCPSCQATSRLFSSWIFARDAYPRRKPLAQALCPKCGQIETVHYQAQSATCSRCRHSFNPQLGPARRKTFICEACGAEHPIAETYRLTDAPPAHHLYALMLLLPDGRKVYKKPDSADLSLYEEAAKAWKRAQEQGALYPLDEIPPGVNTDQARGYNYRFWHQMFNPRQLLCLSLLLEAILEEPDQAVKEQLILLFSGALEFNNLFCSFKGEGTGAVRPLFSHHILKPERTPLENNSWGTTKSSGSFSSLFDRRLLAAHRYALNPFELKAVKHNGHVVGQKVYEINHPLSAKLGDSFEDITSGRAEALILTGDSSSLPVPDGSVDAVVTDPPYFDNVHYSELADFFYAWLRLAFKDSQLSFTKATTRHPSEVQTTNPASFEAGLANVLTECHRVLKPDGIVVFTFQHAREEAWLALLGALEKARLQVVAAYPIKGEMAVATPKSQAREPINLDVVFVCRPFDTCKPTDECSAIEQIVEKVWHFTSRLSNADLRLSKGDLYVIAMSQLVLYCSQHSGDGWATGVKDQHLALLTELRAWLNTLSMEDLASKRHAPRQLRLLETPAPYTAS